MRSSIFTVFTLVLNKSSHLARKQFPTSRRLFDRKKADVVRSLLAVQLTIDVVKISYHTISHKHLLVTSVSLLLAEFFCCPIVVQSLTREQADKKMVSKVLAALFVVVCLGALLLEGVVSGGYPPCNAPCVPGSESIMSQKKHGTSNTPVQSNLRWNCDWDTADRICNYNSKQLFDDYTFSLPRSRGSSCGNPSMGKNFLTHDCMCNHYS